MNGDTRRRKGAFTFSVRFARARGEFDVIGYGGLRRGWSGCWKVFVSLWFGDGFAGGVFIVLMEESGMGRAFPYDWSLALVRGFGLNFVFHRSFGMSRIACFEAGYSSGV